MAHFKTLRFHDKDHYDFKINVNINQEAQFTTYLPADLASDMARVGVYSHRGRGAREGFITSNTFDGLRGKIGDLLQSYFSAKIVEEKLVIRYKVATTCSYMIDKGEFIPNGSFMDTSKGYTWLGGTEESNATYRRPFGLNAYAVVKMRTVTEYRDGQQKIEYGNAIFADSPLYPDGSCAAWLNGVTSNVPLGDRFQQEHLDEMDYTEERAEFFVNLLKFIFTMNEQIKDFIGEPEKLSAMIDSGAKLIGSGK